MNQKNHMFHFFFFQAEDGIRDPLVTGVQTCALPILLERIGGDPPDAGLRAAQLRALVEGGFEFGFHTRRHPVLPNVTDAELSDAMTEGRREIEAIAGAP